jgi:predicted dehydrogenase
MSMKKKLRWGFLSTARINRALIPPLQISPRNVLSAVASRDRGKAIAYANQNHISSAYGSYEDLIADPQIDVVYNPLPNHLHAAWTIRAAEAGKHVLCEKPLALTLAEVDAMIDASQRCGVVVAEAFMYRHHPQTLKVKELVADGKIGTIRLIRGSFSFQLNNPEDIRMDAGMGGGSIWDIGCYPISYARQLLGSEPVEVLGSQTTSPSGVDETFVGHMRFPGDVFAQFDCSFRAPFRTQMEIVGSEGIIRLATPFKPGLRSVLEVQLDGQDTQAYEFEGQELYLGEVEDMADSILTGKAPRVSLADSRANVAAILGLLESARIGKSVWL